MTQMERWDVILEWWVGRHSAGARLGVYPGSWKRECLPDRRCARDRRQ